VEEICTDHDTRATFSSLAMDNSNILSVFCQIIGDILAKWLEEQKGRSIVIIERILGNSPIELAGIVVAFRAASK